MADQSPSLPPRMSPRRKLVSAVLVLVALAILLSLGTWQVQRLHWKEQLLAQMEARRQAAPVQLVDAETALKTGQDQEYLRVRVEGVFDHTKERHFFATDAGRTGFYVYTPLRLADRRELFVNRGFVPYDLKQADKRQAGEVQGTVALTGYLRNRLEGKPSSLVPDNDIQKNIFYWKDWTAMVRSTNLDPVNVVPFFVDADDAVQPPGGWPKAGVTQFELPNNHLQYAVTWYGLAAALVGVSLAMVFRRRKDDPTGR